MKEKEKAKAKRAILGILPKDTLFYYSAKNRLSMVFMLPAGKRIIHSYQTNSDPLDITIDFPQLMISYSSNNQIHVLVVIKGKILIPALKNLSNNGLLCIGNCTIPIWDGRTPIQIKQSIYSTIFEGSFSDDLNEHGFTMMEMEEIHRCHGAFISREYFLSRCTKTNNTVESLLEISIKKMPDEND